MTYRVDGTTYKIEPTSCRCGGTHAWLRQRPTGAWEMVGCVCHTLPTGQRVINDELPPPGPVLMLDQALAQAFVNAAKRVVTPALAGLRRMGVEL